MSRSPSRSRWTRASSSSTALPSPGCGGTSVFSCHTGYPYLLARTSVGDSKAAGLLEARKFLEDRVAAWDKGGKGKGYLKGEGVIEVTEGGDRGRRHRRHPGHARRPDDRQAPPGDPHCPGPHVGAATGRRVVDLEQGGLAPLEHDDYYGAVYAAVGVGHAPEGYAQSEAARPGVEQLLKYLTRTPAPDLHHKTYPLVGVDSPSMG